MSGLTPNDQALGFKASDVPESGAQHTTGAAEPVSSRVDAAPSHSQAQTHAYHPPTNTKVLDEGSESKIVSEAQRDAASMGEPGATRVIKPTHKGDPETVVNDPIIPDSAKDAPWFGVPPAKGVPFKEQVKANALYYRGKFTNDTEKVQEGAAELRGDIE